MSSRLLWMSASFVLSSNCRQPSTRRYTYPYRCMDSIPWVQADVYTLNLRIDAVRREKKERTQQVQREPPKG